MARQAAGHVGRSAPALERQQRFVSIQESLARKQRNPLAALKMNGFYVNTTRYEEHASVKNDRALPSHTGRNVGNITKDHLLRKRAVAPNYKIKMRMPGQEVRSEQDVEKRARAREARKEKLDRAHTNLLRAQGFKARPEDAWKPGDVNWSKKPRRYKPAQHVDDERAEFEEVAQASRREGRDASEEGRHVPKSVREALTRGAAFEDEDEESWDGSEGYVCALASPPPTCHTLTLSSAHSTCRTKRHSAGRIIS